MYQASLCSVGASQGSVSYLSTSRILKMMTHRPTKWQVLIPLDSSTTEIIVANTASAVEFCNKGLVKACSKLRIEFVCKTWNSVSISINSVTLAAELEVIK